MTVAREDYWNAFSRYYLNTVMRGELAFGWGEAEYFHNTISVYHGSGFGVELSVVHQTAILLPSSSLFVYIRDELEYLWHYEYSRDQMENFWGEFVAFTDILGQWREKFPRGEFGY